MSYANCNLSDSILSILKEEEKTQPLKNLLGIISSTEIYHFNGLIISEQPVRTEDDEVIIKLTNEYWQNYSFRLNCKKDKYSISSDNPNIYFKLNCDYTNYQLAFEYNNDIIHIITKDNLHLYHWEWCSIEYYKDVADKIKKGLLELEDLWPSRRSVLKYCELNEALYKAYEMGKELEQIPYQFPESFTYQSQEVPLTKKLSKK